MYIYVKRGGLLPCWRVLFTWVQWRRSRQWLFGGCFRHVRFCQSAPTKWIQIEFNTASASITWMSHVCCTCLYDGLDFCINPILLFLLFPLYCPIITPQNSIRFLRLFRAIYSDGIRITLRYLPDTSVDIRRQRSLADLKWRICSHGPLVAWSK